MGQQLCPAWDERAECEAAASMLQPNELGHFRGEEPHKQQPSDEPANYREVVFFREFGPFIAYATSTDPCSLVKWILDASHCWH